MTVKELHYMTLEMLVEGLGDESIYFETDNSWTKVSSAEVDNRDNLILYDEEITEWKEKRKKGIV